MNEKFKFYLPADLIKAAGPNGSEEMRIKGIASTPSKDSQQEYLDPSGFDLSSFRWLNWNHKGKDDPGTIIGEPDRSKCKITANNEFYIEGLLYPEMPLAQSAFGLMKALQNSPSGNKLSLSVEGKVLKRGSDDPKNPAYKRILKSKITAVALCPIPINGDTWTDLLTKGVTEENSTGKNEEEYDEETMKAIEAAGSVTSKEDVEGTIKQTGLRKSDIYERIFKEYPSLDIEKAKSVYSLIEKIAQMDKTAKTVSEETIKKSFEILNIASEEIAKADTSKKEEKKDDEDDNEMTEKAYCSAKDMKKGGKDKEMMKSLLMKKGYNESVVSKAIEKAWNEKEEEVKKSDTEVGDLIKSRFGIFDKKFQALGEILKSQSEENAELKKSLEEITTANEALKTDLNKVLSQPAGNRKSVTTKSYSEKFEKSTDGKHVYNIQSATDRRNLKLKIEDISGINKGDGKFDQGLMKIAQNLELTKSLQIEELQRLENYDIKVVTQS